MMEFIVSIGIGLFFGFIFGYRFGKKDKSQNNIYGNNNINF